MLRAKTYIAKQGQVSRHWHVIDAKDQILGRVAVRAAHLLRGKHKPIFTPHVDCGDGVILINAERVKLTGAKMDTKTYQSYSGYPGGLKKESARSLLTRRPSEVLRRAVVGMLPKNPLGRQLSTRLKIYAGEKHPHQAQLAKQTAGQTS